MEEPRGRSRIDGGNDRQHARSAEVFELFGRGRAFLLSGSMFEVPKAVEAFRSATALDPSYAAAHAGLALAWCAQADLRLVPPATAYAEARSAALRALAMDASCADAQTALGAVLFLGEWDWLGAERSLTRALELNPNHTQAICCTGGSSRPWAGWTRGSRPSCGRSSAIRSHRSFTCRSPSRT